MGTAPCVCLAPPLAPCLSRSPTKLSGFQGTFLVGCSSASLLTRRSLNYLHNHRKASALCIRSDSNGSADEKPPFGYTRKDVLLIGLGLTLTGVGLKYGLEFAGLDPLKAGNVVQLVMVLGLTVGWISTYLFRVSTKDMTYAKQLRDYENKVIQKRLEELPEAELESLLAQVEEEKQQLKARRAKMSKPE
ncbi:hypothetical protein GOP47_0000152 [Adiantum capillus-veneris]|uniref:Transmembrane protein n=1 Tax=Adiantum capillus-veneris TaxID=13818 RepID=A0A9D4VD16_ADICA|nr:hypothetical protein GOP47_0000152 [Adiantum capillus-veneris]